MNSRWIGTIVCLLYLSISTVFAAIHHHEGATQTNDQCAACAWHHDAQVDVPSVAVSVPQPLVQLRPEQRATVSLRELSVKIHPSRGPPAISL